MKKLLLIIMLFISTFVYSQGVAINNDGSNADPSAILDVKSTDKGIIFPRMTEAQRNAVSGVDGLIIFNITSGCINYYFNGDWYENCGTKITGNCPSGNSDFGDGTSTTTTYPLYSWFNYSRSSSLILKDVESCNFGKITHLSIYVGTTGTHAFTGIEIRLKEISATTLNTTWDGTGTLVWSGSYTFSSTGWVTFDITDFVWDSDNLLITFQHGYTSYTSYYPYFRYTTQSTSLQNYGYSDSALPTTMTTTTNRTNYRLTFE